ncbi:MAG: hypothetical protein MUE84_13330 [Hyphomonas sp.]|jgi:hypothetical protein|nr:hypothetical protein [Hyphomonas sp.]
MDLLTLKRDLPSIDGGRWVDKAELPDLGDTRLKVKGYSSRAVQDAHAARQRALSGDDLDKGKPTAEASERLGLMILQDVLVDAEGFTSGGKPLGVDAIRDALADPAFDPLAKLVMRASMIVDATRAARAEDLRGNS